MKPLVAFAIFTVAGAGSVLGAGFMLTPASQKADPVIDMASAERSIDGDTLAGRILVQDDPGEIVERHVVREKLARVMLRAEQGAALEAAPAISPTTVLSSAELQKLAERAAGAVKDGDIAGARLLLDRAAKGGDATAFLALGETFDPRVLARLKVRGLEPDIGKARVFYAKAMENGVEEAKIRLDRLNELEARN